MSLTSNHWLLATVGSRPPCGLRIFGEEGIWLPSVLPRCLLSTKWASRGSWGLLPLIKPDHPHSNVLSGQKSENWDNNNSCIIIRVQTLIPDVSMQFFWTRLTVQKQLNQMEVPSQENSRLQQQQQNIFQTKSSCLSQC